MTTKSKAIPVKHVPSTVEKIDMATGKRTIEGMSWNILPPPANCCQICGVDHAPDQPHNAQSLYYQTVFQGMNGRAATWADAIAHCDPQTQGKWKSALMDLDAWTEPPRDEQPIAHHGVET